jgi:formamidopyrimidine-DNA glycosylase
MPELPEVEFARRCIERWLEGRNITRAVAEPGKPLRGVTPVELERALSGRRLAAIDRLGKNLLLSFDGDVGLYVHLGMTGKFVSAPAGAPTLDRARLRLELSDGSVVAMIDPRRFGRVRLVPRSELRSIPEVSLLGPDALEDSPSGKLLRQRYGGSRRPLKVLLLEQDRLAGLGNIQAAEVLFRAKLSPFARPADLSPADWNRLANAIRASLRYSLDAESSQSSDEIRYVEERGAPNPFKVYQRAGQPCSRCGTTLRREAQGQRTTFFCPRCQAAPARGRLQARVTPKSRRSRRASVSASSARRKRD